MQKYIISKHIHTSAKDIDEMETVERKQLLKYITDDLQLRSAMMQKVKEGINN